MEPEMLIEAAIADEKRNREGRVRVNLHRRYKISNPSAICKTKRSRRSKWEPYIRW
jgi:hypothetical protein